MTTTEAAAVFGTACLLHLEVAVFELAVAEFHVRNEKDGWITCMSKCRYPTKIDSV